MPKQLRSDADIANSIRCIVSDVDGVMTDGKIVYDSQGTETKCFHVHDGLGIKLWMRGGHRFGILTSRESQMVQRRAEELRIQHVVQGVADKRPAFLSMAAALDCPPQQVCYVGDDLPDVSVMRSDIGLAVAPADAATDARNHADWVLRSGGGQGAIRELIERLMRASNQWEEVIESFL